MSKNSNSARKNAARGYAAAHNISYTAALRGLASGPKFRDSDFRLPGRVDRYPSSQQLHVARGGGYVEIRNSALVGTPDHQGTAIRLTEDEFDQHQLSARRGYPDYSVLRLVTYDTVYTYTNAKDPDSNTLTSDLDAFIAFLDGIHRGDFGGPAEETSDGLTSGGAMLVQEHDADLSPDQEHELLLKAAEWVITRQTSSYDELRTELGTSFGRTSQLLIALESFHVVSSHRGPVADRDVLAAPEDLDDRIAAIRAGRPGARTKTSRCQQTLGDAS